MELKTNRDFVNKLAEALTHLVYRDGFIEVLHRDKTKNLFDSDMKKLNKEIHNRIYTVLLLLLSQNEMSTHIYKKMLYGNYPFGYMYRNPQWDKAEIDMSIIASEYRDDIKEIEKEFENTVYNRFKDYSIKVVNPKYRYLISPEGEVMKRLNKEQFEMLVKNYDIEIIEN